MGRPLDAKPLRFATGSVLTLRVTIFFFYKLQVECIHYGPFAPNSLLSAVPFADAASRKPCLKVSRLTAPTAIRIFDNSTPPSSRTAFDAKGLADASPRRLCFQPSKAGCITMFAQLRCVYCILPAFPQFLQDFLNNNLCYRCSNWGERNVSTTHRASATIGPPSATTATN